MDLYLDLDLLFSIWILGFGFTKNCGFGIGFGFQIRNGFGLGFQFTNGFKSKSKKPNPHSSSNKHLEQFHWEQGKLFHQNQEYLLLKF